MLTVAQIGVGYWGPNLLRNLAVNKRCTVKTVVDLSTERREYVRRSYPAIQVTDDLESVLQDSEIDAAIIATPVATHFDLATRVLNTGKNVLVEKPLATSVKEVDEIAEIAKDRNLVAMVGHTFLFSPPVRYVKALLDSGALGEVRYIYSQRLNLGQLRPDVDALWNLAPHDVSIIQYWLDDPTPLSVSRHGAAYVQQDIDDVVFLNITYPNKTVAHIHVSWLDPRRVRMMVITGTKKMVVYDDTAENKIAIFDKGIDQIIQPKPHSFPPSFTYRSGDVLMPKLDSHEPLRLEIDHFFDCVTNGTDCLTGPRHARKVVQILSSAQQL